MKNKEPQNCWDFFHCPDEVRDNCPAKKNGAGRACWTVAQGFKADGCPKIRNGEIKYCWECAWFQKLNPNFNNKVKNLAQKRAGK